MKVHFEHFLSMGNSLMVKYIFLNCLLKLFVVVSGKWEDASPTLLPGLS